MRVSACLPLSSARFLLMLGAWRKVGSLVRSSLSRCQSSRKLGSNSSSLGYGTRLDLGGCMLCLSWLVEEVKVPWK
jgi:hypothetical protein